jgi:hypothetical protein
MSPNCRRKTAGASVNRFGVTVEGAAAAADEEPKALDMRSTSG